MLSIKKIGKLGKRYRHLMRYRQIIGITLKYGFDNILDALNIDHYIESGLRLIPFSKPHEPFERLSREERIRMALEELGPTFIKMGQVLSARPDLIPVRLIAELTKLQDHIPPFEFEKVQRIISLEFGKEHQSLFQSIQETPFASASIGQVHLASITGREQVAVKVQRPGIRRAIEADLEILHHLAGVMERNIEEVAFFKPVRIVEEFARTLEKELDYTIEAANMKRMGLQFSRDTSVHIPRVYSRLSGERVLTMEYIDGIKASDIAAIDRAGLNRKRITRRGADFILKQVFTFGFFHADPHPGNIFVLPRDRICPVDFGMTGFLDRSTRELLEDILHAIATDNATLASRLVTHICEYESLPDMGALEKDIAQFISVHVSRSLKEIRTARMVTHLLEMLARHGLRIPPDLFLMLKAFVAIEGVARELDPDFDMIRHAIPYVTTSRFTRFSASRISGELISLARETFKLLKVLPTDTAGILHQLRQGKLSLTIRIQGLEKLMITQDQSSNRISFAIIIAALILGSAIVINSRVPPMLFGVSVIGIGGFSAAAILGVWLVVAIIRKGRL